LTTPKAGVDAMFDCLYATLPDTLAEQLADARHFASDQGERHA
jgi:hypothetical protein